VIGKMSMRFNLLAAACAITLLGACTTTYDTGAVAPVERIADHLSATGADRAEMLAANGNFGSAAVLYQAQVVEEPKNIELKHKLAEAYRLGGNPAQARAVFLEIAAVDGWQARGLEGVGRVAMSSGDLSAAQQAFESATLSEPLAWRSWLALAQLSDLESSWAKADERYAIALSVTTEPAVVYNNLGISFMARGNPEHAATIFREALQKDPTLAKARTNLDLAEAAAGRALPASDTADSRERARRLNNFAYVAEIQDRRQDAILLYEAAVQQHPAFYAKAFNRLSELKRLPPPAEDKHDAMTVHSGAHPAGSSLSEALTPEFSSAPVSDAASSAGADAMQTATSEAEPQP